MENEAITGSTPFAQRMTRAETAPDAQSGTAFYLLRLFVGFCILPNFVIGLAAHAIGVERQIINLDYLLLGIVGIYVRRGWSIATLVAAVIADAFVNFAPIFNFELPDALNALKDIGRIDNRGIVLATLASILVASGLLAAAIVAVAGRPRSNARRGSIFLLATMLGIAGIDVLNGSNRYISLSHASLPFNLATSDGAKLAEAAVGMVRERSGPPEQVPSAAAGLWKFTGAPGQQHVLLVIVESLGMLKDPAGDSLLLAPLETPAIRRKYSIRSGSVPTSGSTTSGEMRELCGIRASHRDVRRLSLGSCLPSVLAARGYQTASFHGYKKTFFGRSTWYPLLGFSHSTFDEELRPGGVGRVCGFVYRGACDADVGQLVHEALARSESARPAFVYWLTLNAHFPMDEKTAAAGTFSCSAYAPAAANGDVCRLMRIESIVLDAVRDIALDSTLIPTHIVIVGDHPPPFARESTRGLFAEERVPFLELSPIV